MQRGCKFRDKNATFCGKICSTSVALVHTYTDRQHMKANFSLHSAKKGKFPAKIVVETLKNVKILTNSPFFGFLCKINLQEPKKVPILASLIH